MATVMLASFGYGQRHRIELCYARQAASWLRTSHHVGELSALRNLLHGSVLTDPVEFPDGHYTDVHRRVDTHRGRCEA